MTPTDPPSAEPAHSCCAPSPTDLGADRSGLPLAGRKVASSIGTDRHRIEQSLVPAGDYLMGDGFGDGFPGDGEAPVHQVEVSAFSIDATSVTNTDFARFADDTGYLTEAERFGFSAVFHLAVEAPPKDIMRAAPGSPWWLGVRGADWRHPGGSRSDLEGRDDHPVVHISWNDATAYCEWAGRRLPAEAEWEYAARGGLEGRRYPWGDEPLDPHTDAWRCNIWQGRFPTANDLSDGYLTTAPVRTYAPNAHGLWQTVGNVWEWCKDWFSPRTYELDARQGTVTNPQGPRFGTTRVMRGGSYLCHDSYCNRYRNAARTANTPDSSMGNTGFRTVSLRFPAADAT
ncbi:formylglycine-generating enzyme required for sulfatase activity [Kribbella sp. VKM Ac-2569]|uniref:formylglycine-generating enzyme family protein n=1 Tax=Kribbella sp. VKM Ac-2569 TaxID=2512220 RepID=UPI00102B346C|nr:formylglycine-generating enzyme family protein [Kribbella sp. VKM Ac-2569]RZT27520.1 formylglycine-generating enzyme required for sulfatase activity [Kribbella sp. VKM Ac-2569]